MLPTGIRITGWMLVLSPALSPVLDAQSLVVSGRVVSTAGPLSHTLVGIPSLERYVFTNDSGAFELAIDRGPSIGLVIRKIGYQPLDTTLSVTTDAVSVKIALTPIAIRLSAVTVRAESECNEPASSQYPSDALAMAMTQLRLNADQLRLLSDRYPFESQMETARAETRHGDASPRLVFRDTVVIRSQSRWHYKAGNVVTGTRRYTFNIPTVIDVGSEEFLSHHCFYFRGLDSLDNKPVLRVDFAASNRLAKPDVDGSLFLDPERFQIRRSLLRLSPVPRNRGVRAYEVITDFSEIMESVPVMSHIFATQTLDQNTSAGLQAVYEEWRLLEVRFTGLKPLENGASVIRVIPP